MGPPGYEKPGPHRFIGIGMAAGMVFIVLVLWLILGKWPRRIAKAHCCCYRRKTELVAENGEESIEDGTNDTHSHENKLKGLTGQKSGVELQYAMAQWKIPHVRRVSHELNFG